MSITIGLIPFEESSNNQGKLALAGFLKVASLMSEEDKKSLKLFQNASDYWLCFAAAESLRNLHYDEFCQHTGYTAADPGFYHPSVERVDQLSDTEAKLIFRRRYRLFGNRIAPFVVSIRAIAKRLEVVGVVHGQ